MQRLPALLAHVRGTALAVAAMSAAIAIAADEAHTFVSRPRPARPTSATPFAGQINSAPFQSLRLAATRP